MKPIIIGIAGGTGSGKSTVTKRLSQIQNKNETLVIKQDNYYKDQSFLPFEERVDTNYDHPSAFDNDLFIQHIKDLRDSKAIEMPLYDYTLHTRKKDTIRIEPKSVILIEGILIFVEKEMRELFDIRIFVDTDCDVRILRRVKRDIRDRGRSLDSIIKQYFATVRPAHLEFVEPSKQYADIIIPEGGHNDVAINLIETKINSFLEENKISVDK